MALVPCSLSASELRLAAALLPREHVVRFDFVDGHVALAHRLVVGMPRLGAFLKDLIVRFVADRLGRGHVGVQVVLPQPRVLLIRATVAICARSIVAAEPLG